MAIFDKVTGKRLYKTVVVEGIYRLSHIIHKPFTHVATREKLTPMEAAIETIRCERNSGAQLARINDIAIGQSENGRLVEYHEELTKLRA